MVGFGWCLSRFFLLCRSFLVLLCLKPRVAATYPLNSTRCTRVVPHSVASYRIESARNSRRRNSSRRAAFLAAPPRLPPLHSHLIECTHTAASDVVSLRASFLFSRVVIRALVGGACIRFILPRLPEVRRRARCRRRTERAQPQRVSAMVVCNCCHRVCHSRILLSRSLLSLAQHPRLARRGLDPSLSSLSLPGSLQRRGRALREAQHQHQVQHGERGGGWGSGACARVHASQSEGAMPAVQQPGNELLHGTTAHTTTHCSAHECNHSRAWHGERVAEARCRARRLQFTRILHRKMSD